MSSNPVDPMSADIANRDEARKSIRSLAEARQSAAGRAATSGSNATSGAISSPSHTAKGADDIAFISDQAQHDFAEIASATTALRSAQPDLEAWSTPKVEAAPTRKPRSVWLMIGAVWISTVLLMAMATLSIASLLR